MLPLDLSSNPVTCTVQLIHAGILPFIFLSSQSDDTPLRQTILDNMPRTCLWKTGVCCSVSLQAMIQIVTSTKSGDREVRDVEVLYTMKSHQIRSLRPRTLIDAQLPKTALLTSDSSDFHTIIAR